MKSLTIIFKNLFVKDLPLPLGRWKINNCNTQQLNYKIDMANEDHCGPCGEYAIEKNNKYKNNKDKVYHKKYDKKYYKKYNKNYHKKYDAPNILHLNDKYNSDYMGY
jgi:hypothetical protein